MGRWWGRPKQAAPIVQIIRPAGCGNVSWVSLSMRLADTDYSGSADFFIPCRTMAVLRIGPLKKQPALHFVKCRLLWAEPSADGAGFIQTRHRFHHRPEVVPGGGCAVQAGCSAAVRVLTPAACRRRFAVPAALNG